MNKKEAKGGLPHFNVFPKSRKGQGLSTTAIILIILGVIILAMLILGFTVGFNKLFGFASDDSNVAEIEQACELACSTGSTYDFCSRPRLLNDGEGKGDQSGTCDLYSKETSTFGIYRIDKCPTITCTQPTP